MTQTKKFNWRTEALKNAKEIERLSHRLSEEIRRANQASEDLRRTESVLDTVRESRDTQHRRADRIEHERAVLQQQYNDTTHLYGKFRETVLRLSLGITFGSISGQAKESAVTDLVSDLYRTPAPIYPVMNTVAALMGGENVHGR